MYKRQVYENESVDVMDFDEKWAHVKKDNAEGYVLRSHLRYFRRYDPVSYTHLDVYKRQSE